MAGAVRSHLIWVLIGILGAFDLGLIAIDRGEHVNALWIVVATVAVDLIASGHAVFHILGPSKIRPASLTPGARPCTRGIVYPAALG